MKWKKAANNNHKHTLAPRWVEWFSAQWAHTAVAANNNNSFFLCWSFWTFIVSQSAALFFFCLTIKTKQRKTHLLRAKIILKKKKKNPIFFWRFRQTLLRDGTPKWSMSLRLSWLSSLPYLPRVCLYPRTSTPFTDPWSGHSSVIPWIGGPSSGGCCHGNCRGNRRQTRGHGWLPGVKTLDERQRQRYNHGPCGTGVPWDKKKSAFCGETAAAGRIFVAGHVSRRGSSTGTWQLFKVVSEIFTRVSAAVDVLRRFYIQEFENWRWNDELTQIHTQKLLDCFLHFADAERKFRCCISYRYFLWCTWTIFFRTLFSSVRFALVASAGFGTRNENWRSLSDILVLKKKQKNTST